MTVTTNRSRLVTQVLTGEVWPAVGDRHAYRVDADGAPFVLPGMGGVTLGVHPGDIAAGYAADHLEPGLSIRHRDERANMALQFLSCVGNVVTVRTGPSAGARGRVIGQHAYVLADFTDDELDGICVGDQVTVHAYGQGLRLPDHPEVVVKNVDPSLVDALNLETGPDGRLRVPIAVRVPAEAVGAGAGMYSEYANTDLMGAYAGQGEDLSLGLEGLRIGDVVVLADQDHRYGRGYRAGYTTIGVISTGHCRLFGHGPGPSTLMSGPSAAFDIHLDDQANLGTLFSRLGAPA
jgi:hypothetical protein